MMSSAGAYNRPELHELLPTFLNCRQRRHGFLRKWTVQGVRIVLAQLIVKTDRRPRLEEMVRSNVPVGLDSSQPIPGAAQLTAYRLTNRETFCDRAPA